MDCRNQFTFYKSFDDAIEGLNDSQILEYLKTMLDVQFLRIKIDDVVFEDKILSFIWKAQKHSIEKSIKGYLDSQKSTNVKNPYLGIYAPIQRPSEGVRQQDKEQVKDKEQDKVGRKKFSPPSFEQVEAYIKDNNLNVDAKHFYDFFTEGNWYDTKGNKVKNWKQKILTWNRHADSKPKQTERKFG